jgi:VanZ family protein
MINKRRVLPFVLAVLLLLLITVLLCTPGTDFPNVTWKDKVFLDKWIHAALFALLVLAWCWSYSNKQREVKGNKWLFMIIAMLGFVYGIGIEIIQELSIPFRSFEIPDIIADGVGAAAGYFIAVKRFAKK